MTALLKLIPLQGSASCLKAELESLIALFEIYSTLLSFTVWSLDP